MAPMQGAQDNGNFGANPSSDTKPLLTGQVHSAEAPTKKKETAEDYAKYAFYNIRKYRPYFDVDTKEVGWRVLSSFIGAFKPDFMDKASGSLNPGYLILPLHTHFHLLLKVV